ncbi:MAG: transposase [Rhodospirillaceae bacterium]|nr:transposase [Rhodospirillales bacterium]
MILNGGFGVSLRRAPAYSSVRFILHGLNADEMERVFREHAAGFPATAWAAAIRGHWGIENRNHYVRDVSCDEDKSRIRDNPGIIARARSFALNIMRKNGITNVAQALWNGGSHPGIQGAI